MSAVHVLVARSVCLAVGPALTAPLPPEKSRLIAHRGESLEAPANGLEAFRLAFGGFVLRKDVDPSFILPVVKPDVEIPVVEVMLERSQPRGAAD